MGVCVCVSVYIYRYPCNFTGVSLPNPCPSPPMPDLSCPNRKCQGTMLQAAKAQRSTTQAPLCTVIPNAHYLQRGLKKKKKQASHEKTKGRAERSAVRLAEASPLTLCTFLDEF